MCPRHRLRLDASAGCRRDRTRSASACRSASSPAPVTALTASTPAGGFARSLLVATPRTGGCSWRKISLFRPRRFVGRQTQQQQIGLRRLFTAERLGLFLDRIFAVPPAGRVHQLDHCPAEVETLYQVIASRPRLRADQGRRPAQRVEQAAFAGVRPSRQHHAERPARHRPRVQLPRRRRQLRHAARQPMQQVVAAHEGNVLVGEIQGGLHVGQQVQQVFAQPLQGTGEAAGQLDQGPFQLAFVVGFHDRLHRLGPRQVQLAGQERPQRELPRPRGAAPDCSRVAVKRSRSGGHERVWISTTSSPVYVFGADKR